MASDPPCPEGAASSSCRRRREPPSLKRKLDDTEEHPAGPRVEPEDEVAALREAVDGHREMVAQLCAELEEEREASASAASEAMSMILRLQREKGEAQMEARQFRRFAEEKMEHDRQELAALEDLLYDRERVIRALSCEVRAYRDRLLSYGIPPDSLEPALDAPALEGEDGEGPASPLAPAIRHGDDLERSPSPASLLDEMEKGVVTGQSPHVLPGEPACSSGEQQEQFHSSDVGGDNDNTSDRVYTVDAVHSGAARVGGNGQDYVCTTEETACRVHESYEEEEEEVDVRKLEMRLRALEADRESMRQAIISMRSDKAQLVFLKEVAQRLCRDVSAHSAPAPEGKMVRKPFLLWCFSFISMIKATIKASLLGHLSFMSTTIKVYTWAIEQCRVAVTSRNCPTDTTVAMSLENRLTDDSSIFRAYSCLCKYPGGSCPGLVTVCEMLYRASWTQCDLIVLRLYYFVHSFLF